MNWDDFSAGISHFAPLKREAVKKAYLLGQKAHAGQQRKSGEPYFSHPIAVANILLEMDADSDTVIAALLHDTVEDTDVTLETITVAFGSGVSGLVDGVTKLVEKDFADSPDMNEQVETLRKMFTLMQEDVRIMVIKLADRLHNMQTLQHRTKDKQISVATETLNIYVKIADRLCMRNMRNLLEEECRKYLEPEDYEGILSIREKNKQESKERIEQITSELKKINGDNTFTEIAYEAKTWKKLRTQYELEGPFVTGLSGLNIIFICEKISDCYVTLGNLHQLWTRETLSFEDFINAPVINGYMGLHTTILMKDGMRVRCKIRTKAMQEYAEKGITLYCFDSQSKGALDYLPWVDHISPLSEDTKNRSELFWQSLQSDILGESIVVHGENKRMLIPQGSTALDAAFYLYGKKALKVHELQINGRNVQLYEEVPSAATITATFSSSNTVTIHWLKFVHSGIASAIIRKELANATTQSKLTLGRELLSSAMRLHAGMGIDELSPTIFKKKFKGLQATSLEDLYTQIGEGKLEANDVVRSIFSNKNNGKDREEWIVRVRSYLTEQEKVERIIHQFSFKSFSQKVRSNIAYINVHSFLNRTEMVELERNLETVLAPDQWSIMRKHTVDRMWLALILLVLLWGLDPVFAKLILNEGISPFQLTVVRFVTFFFTGSALFGMQHFLAQGRNLKPLSPFRAPLIASGIALFSTAFFTYATLKNMDPTAYIVFIISGLVLTQLFRSIIYKKDILRKIASFSFIAAIITFILSRLEFNSFSLLTAIGSSLSFALYAEISKRYQEEVASIQARYPSFIFWISTACLLLSVFFINFFDFTLPPVNLLVQAVVFALIFAALPYILFFEVNRRNGGKMLDKTLPLVFIATITGELLVFKNVRALLVSPVLLIFLWQYLQTKK